ncbi:MAG: adenylate/guanylate cyclase domain-containing protein [Thermodesulfobacteriota bacterium]
MSLSFLRINTMARSYLINILYTTVFWFFAVLLFVLLRTVGIKEGGDFLTLEHDHLELDVITVMLGGLILGIAFGILDIFLDTEKIRKKSYGFIILVKSIFHVAVLILVTYAIVVIVSLFEAGIDLKEAYSFSFSKWTLSEDFLVALAYLWVASMMISSIKQVNLNFGPGNLVRFMLGTYHHPRVEERIFMFLDMKSSTTHAERLGHIRYSELIQDCFSDLTDVVIERKVEVYHYVGDEAVLTWKVKQGLDDANCLRAFFDFEKVLYGKSNYYSKKYEFSPEFKAGVNIGLATIAEVGEIKREIHFHGDVLNTAARLQSECNHYNKKMLISEDLRGRFSDYQDLNFELIGDIILKGKERKLNIYSVEEKQDSDKKLSD